MPRGYTVGSALVAVRTDGLTQLAKDLKAADVKAPRRLARRLKEAGEIVAADARRKASWSVKIPPSIKVTGGARSVSVRAGGPGAPMAYTFEAPTGKPVRHPVFGHRDRWVTQAPRPFLRAALAEDQERVAEKVSQVVDDIIRDAGWR